MQALDFEIDGRPVNRIEVVKSVVSKFIEERPNDRIGIIAFAGAPYLVSPLTLDHDWLQQNLERVHTAVASDDGTAIGSAIAASVNRLRNTRGEIQSRHSAHRRHEQHRQDLAARRRRSRQGAGREDLHHRRRRARHGAHTGEGRSRQHPSGHGSGGCRREDSASAWPTRPAARSIAPRTPIPWKRSTSKSIGSRQPHRPCRSSNISEELYSWALIPARQPSLGFGLLLQHTRFRRLP